MMISEYYTWYTNIKFRSKQPTQEELKQKMESQEQKLIQNLQSHCKNVTIKLNLEIFEHSTNLYKTDNQITQNKLEFYLDFINHGHQNYLRNTIHLNIYVQNEDFLSQIQSIIQYQKLLKLKKLQIFLKNSIKITQNFLNSFNLLTETISHQDELESSLQYISNPSLLYLKLHPETLPSETWFPDSFDPITDQQSLTLTHFSLPNHQQDTLKTLINNFSQKIETLKIGENYLKRQSYPEIQYENFNTILIQLKNFELLKKLTLNLQSYNKLTPKNIDFIINFLENSKSIKYIIINFEEIDQYPYLKESQLLNKFFLFNHNKKDIKELSISIKENKFSISQTSIFPKKLYSLTQYHSYSNSLARIRDMNKFSYHYKPQFTEKEQTQMKFNSDFNKYEKTNLTENQLKCLINLMKNDQFKAITSYQTELNSCYLYESSEYIQEFLHVLTEQLISFEQKQEMLYSLQFGIQHLKNPNTIQKFKQFIQQIPLKVSKLEADIQIIHNNTYKFQMHKKQSVILFIEAFESKKLPYIDSGIELFSQLKELQIISSVEISDLQLWSLFQSLTEKEMPNLRKLKLNFTKCEELTDEFCLDFSKFMSKKAEKLKYFQLELHHNKKITQQGIKQFCKSFLHLSNAKKVKLNFSNIRLLKFEYLSLLMKFLSQKNDKLTKFKLQSDQQQEISLLNQGFSTLLSTQKATLKKFLIFLPKASFEKPSCSSSVSPKKLFTSELDINSIDLFVFGFQQVLIYYQNYYSHKKPKNGLMHYIYLMSKAEESHMIYSADFISAYLQSLQQKEIKKLKFKIYSAPYYLIQQEKDIQKKYLETIKYRSFMFSLATQDQISQLLWEKIQIGLKTLKNLQIFHIQDFHLFDPFSGQYDISINFQNAIKELQNKQNLKKIKITNDYYQFILIFKTVKYQNIFFKGLNKLLENRTLYFKETILETVHTKKSQNYWVGNHNNNYYLNQRVDNCIKEMKKNFDVFSEFFANKIEKLDTFIQSYELKHKIFPIVNQFAQSMGPYFKDLVYDMPDVYYITNKDYEDILKLDLESKFQIQLFKEEDERFNLSYEYPELYEIKQYIDEHKEKRSQQQYHKVLIIKNLKQNLKQYDPKILKDIIQIYQ